MKTKTKPQWAQNRPPRPVNVVFDAQMMRVTGTTTSAQQILNAFARVYPERPTGRIDTRPAKIRKYLASLEPELEDTDEDDYED